MVSRVLNMGEEMGTLSNPQSEFCPHPFTQYFSTAQNVLKLGMVCLNILYNVEETDFIAKPLHSVSWHCSQSLGSCYIHKQKQTEDIKQET
jgi:hypothetical protein